MILIRNISKELKPFGEQEYEIRINKELITTFTHQRELGLAKCLLEASKAVEKKRWENAIKLLEFDKL